MLFVFVLCFLETICKVFSLWCFELIKLEYLTFRFDVGIVTPINPALAGKAGLRDGLVGGIIAFRLAGYRLEEGRMLVGDRFDLIRIVLISIGLLARTILVSVLIYIVVPG